MNSVDTLISNTLDKFNEYLMKKKLINKFISDTNFVKFQQEILSEIKIFVDSVPEQELKLICKTQNHIDYVKLNLKRYIAFYIYLSVGHFYKGDRELYITNIIETSKYQKDTTIQIPNFFNSDNNSKLIKFFTIQKQLIDLLKLKSMDKIKILLGNNPTKYQTTIEFLDIIGQDWVQDNLFVAEPTHPMIKAIIFKTVYLIEDKNEILKMINQEEKDDGEYKYIEIVVGSQGKIADFTTIQKFLILNNLNPNMAEEIYSYLEDMKKYSEMLDKSSNIVIDWLFTNDVLIPITEDFLRYHKDSEKYEAEKLVEEGVKERDATKIKYVTSKITNIKNYYSPLLENNPKMKLDIEKMFYKQLDPKMVILYNNDEEVKIIQKLKTTSSVMSGNVNSDLLIELDNIRTYGYVNFKNFSKAGIKLRPSKSIQGIRKTNLSMKNKEMLETRISNDMLDISMIGIAFNPSKRSLDCFTTKDLIDVRKVGNEKNGYVAFKKIMAAKYGRSSNSLYYWLFDMETDVPKTKEYISFEVNAQSQTQIQNNIKIMLEQLHKDYVNIVSKKLEDIIEDMPPTTSWAIADLLRHWDNKLLNWDLNPTIKNQVIEKLLLGKVPQLLITPDPVDSHIPGIQEELIELPVIKREKIKSSVIELGKVEIDVSLEMSGKNLAICNHWVKWGQINKISKSSEEFNQAIFDFVKQYVDISDKNDYICKSCGETVQIQKYVSEASFTPEGDTIITTSPIVNQNLEQIPKYSKFLKTIRNIEKNIEKFAYSIDLVSYVGNTPVIKLRRKMIVKDTIDLVLLHTEWIKENSKNRGDEFSRKYGIDKNKSSLFFFELKDDIFLTSSTDTDKYKIIKYNNIISWIVFNMITELNPGQILGMKQDKMYNYYIFKQFGYKMFDGLFLRVSQKEKISVMKLPLFAYTLYYLSGQMVANRIWLYNNNDVSNKERTQFNIETQKIIIHTLLDLFNSLAEANFAEGKNYMYEIIHMKISVKLANVFNDAQLIKRIEELANKIIGIDTNTNKIVVKQNKIPAISLDTPYNPIVHKSVICTDNIVKLNTLDWTSASNMIDILTNCADGRFHIWAFKNNDLTCSLCNASYNDLKTKRETSESLTENGKHSLDEIRFNYLKKLSQKYCLTGEQHDLDSNKKCLKCGIDLNNWKPNNKDLEKLENSMDNKTTDNSRKMMELIKKSNEEFVENNIKGRTILNKLFKRYEEIGSSSILLYTKEFVNKLSKILGGKLKDTNYIINHDYMGNELKEPITLTSSENKFQIVQNHSLFPNGVGFYKDNKNNAWVYYHPINYQYLGYSTDNKTLKKTNSNASIKVVYSLEQYILLLGYPNAWYNMKSLDSERKWGDNLGDESKDIAIKILRERIMNLKQIITRTQSIIHKVKNSLGSHNEENIKNIESTIVNEFVKKLAKFNLKNIEGHDSVFKNYQTILSKIPLNYNLPNTLKIDVITDHIDLNNLNMLSNSDCKLLFYLLFNLDRLLEYNKDNKTIQYELANLIVRSLNYSSSLYWIDNNSSDIRKFEYLTNTEATYIDDNIKVVGVYNELLTKEELDNPEKKEEAYDEQEAQDAFDIDDYDDNDDIQESAEVFDGYEE